MKLSYKYRIYPNVKQREALFKTFSFCNGLYNAALQERISHYKKYNKGVSYNDQAKQLPDIKALFEEETNSIYSQSLQFILKTLDVAFQGFFRRVKQSGLTPGFPRYKPISKFKSIKFPQCDLVTGGVKLLPNKKLKVYGLPGEVSIVLHRPIKGRCKTVSIKREGDKYYLIAFCDEVPMLAQSKTGKTTGIDLGINSFITTDDGISFHHPKPYKTAKEKLAFLNKKLSAKQKGSKNRRRVLSMLQKAHQKVSDIRNDWQHKIANQFVKENDTVYVEKLNISTMLEAKGFKVSKSNITDASWGNFVSLMKYKAERAGVSVIEVDPRNTSKMCSSCKMIKKDLSLKDRIYDCQSCGLTINRDQNAAINIKRFGISLATTLKVVSEAPPLRAE
jgi:putative transposase